MPIVPVNWNRVIFHEVIDYNVQFQLIAFTSMLCEPITKYCLSSFGGIDLIGYYEMASRLAGQVGVVLVSANQALVPTIANYAEHDTKKVLGLYVHSFQLLLFIILPVYCLLLLAVPLISQLWMGGKNEIFMLALYAFFSAHMINILSNPAYFANIGIGRLKSNLIAHVGMVICNLLLAYIWGMPLGGRGVIIAWSITLILGGVYIFLSYNQENKIALRDILPGHFIRLMLFVAAVFCVGEICLAINRGRDILAISLVVISIAAVGIVYFQCRHPFFAKISKWFIHKRLEA